MKQSKVTLIYHGDKKDFEPKTMMVDGELMEVIPSHYRRTTVSENGETTVEFSLTPFDNETAKKGDPR